MSSWNIGADNVIGITRTDPQTLQVRIYTQQCGGSVRTIELHRDEVLDIRISAPLGSVTVMGLYPAARLGRGRVLDPGEDS